MNRYLPNYGCKCVYANSYTTRGGANKWKESCEHLGAGEDNDFKWQQSASRLPRSRKLRQLQTFCCGSQWFIMKKVLGRLKSKLENGPTWLLDSYKVVKWRLFETKHIQKIEQFLLAVFQPSRRHSILKCHGHHLPHIGPYRTLNYLCHCSRYKKPRQGSTKPALLTLNSKQSF